MPPYICQPPRGRWLRGRSKEMNGIPNQILIIVNNINPELAFSGEDSREIRPWKFSSKRPQTLLLRGSIFV